MRKLLYLLITLYPLLLQAQVVPYFKITEQDGLPSNTIYNLFQDNKGFLWIATENGLTRYNGFQFYTYDNPKVRSRAVSGILQDEKQRLWLHNFFGEVLYVENDSLKKLDSWENYYTSGFPTISSLKDQIFITVPSSFYQYQPGKDDWKTLNINSSTDTPAIHYNHHTVMHNHEVMVCYTIGETTYIKNTSTQEVTQIHRKDEILSLNVLRLVEFDDQLFLFDYAMEKLFTLKNGKAENVTDRFKPYLKNVTQMSVLQDTLLAFMGNDGIRLIGKNGFQQQLLSGKQVSSAVFDREGGLWIGTLTEGLFYLPSLSSTIYNKESFKDFSKLAFDPIHRNIFIGNHDGSVTQLTEDGKVIVHHQSDQKTTVQSLFVDTTAQRLLVFSDKLYIYQLPAVKLLKSIRITATKKILRLRDKYVLATSGGLTTLNANTFLPETYITNLRTSAIAYDQKKEILWIGSQKGIAAYDLIKQKENTWTMPGTHYSPGASDIILHGKNVIIGTYNNGVIILDEFNKHKQIAVAEGLPSSHVTALDLHDNQLWVGTDKGVALLNLTNYEVISIDASKGLASKEVYDLIVNQDRLYITHPQGLQVLPTKVLSNTQQPYLLIQSVTSDNELLSQPMQGITLNPGSQQLTFQFDVANNLRSHGTTRILYRIKELEQDRWNETTLRFPIANYLSLPSGKFSFEAYAINEDGVKSAKPVVIAINVLSPFWKQNWFMLVTFVFITTIIILLLYLRFQRQSRRNREKLQQQNQEQALRIAQLTSIRAQMNPHFIFNTMSLIQGKVLNGLKEEANDQIQYFSSLLRKVLNFSGKETILLHDEIEVLQKYLFIEKSRFDGALNYSITVNEAAKQEMIRIPSLLTQPFVENAIRHGLMHKSGEKILTIDFQLNEDLLTISITDNGIGRKASGEFNKSRRKDHQSFAVEANQKRIDLLNATRQHHITLTITDHYNEHNIATGTSVIIQVPLDLGING
jgi:ligand-binding sensor domain-containing protein